MARTIEEPEPEVCQFCGARLPYRKQEIPEINFVRWAPPEPCTCPGSQALQEELRRIAAEERARREAEEAKKRRLALLEKCRLPKRYWECRFETAQVDENNEKAVAKAKAFAERFVAGKRDEGLFLSGPVGTGKTFLASCVVNYLIDHGIRVLFGNVLDLLGRLRRSYDEDAQEEEWRIIDELSCVPLLVIDDLGKEKVSEWVEQTLYRIVDIRYRESRSLVVTSNFTVSELEQRYQEVGPALVSRIVEMCEGVPVKGDDRRKLR